SPQPLILPTPEAIASLDYLPDFSRRIRLNFIWLKVARTFDGAGWILAYPVPGKAEAKELSQEFQFFRAGDKPKSPASAVGIHDIDGDLLHIEPPPRLAEGPQMSEYIPVLSPGGIFQAFADAMRLECQGSLRYGSPLNFTGIFEISRTLTGAGHVFGFERLPKCAFAVYVAIGPNWSVALQVIAPLVSMRAFDSVTTPQGQHVRGFYHQAIRSR